MLIIMPILAFLRNNHYICSQEPMNNDMRKLFYCIISAAMIMTGCKNTKTQPTVQEPVETPPDYAGWVIGSFVDQFGEKTDKHFLRNTYQGKISTSTLGDIDMVVKCNIDSSAFQMEFYEYGKYFVKNFGYSWLNIKDVDGKVHEFRQYSNDGMRFVKKDRDSILTMISQEGTIKLSARIEENGTGRLAKFSIKGTPRLRELMNEAKVK